MYLINFLFTYNLQGVFITCQLNNDYSYEKNEKEKSFYIEILLIFRN